MPARAAKSGSLRRPAFLFDLLKSAQRLLQGIQVSGELPSVVYVSIETSPPVGPGAAPGARPKAASGADNVGSARARELPVFLFTKRRCAKTDFANHRAWGCPSSLSRQTLRQIGRSTTSAQQRPDFIRQCTTDQLGGLGAHPFLSCGERQRRLQVVGRLGPAAIAAQD